MHNRLYKHLSEHIYLYEKQLGFQVAHLTDHAVIQVHENIQLIQLNENTIGIFNHLSKASDTVDHQKLLHESCMKPKIMIEKMVSKSLVK